MAAPQTRAARFRVTHERMGPAAGVERRSGSGGSRYLSVCHHESGVRARRRQDDGVPPARRRTFSSGSIAFRTPQSAMPAIGRTASARRCCTTSRGRERSTNCAGAKRARPAGDGAAAGGRGNRARLAIDRVAGDSGRHGAGATIRSHSRRRRCDPDAGRRAPSSGHSSAIRGPLPDARVPDAVRPAARRSRSTRRSRTPSSAATPSSCRMCEVDTSPTVSFDPTRTKAATDTTRSSGPRGSRGRTAGSAHSGCPIPVRCNGSPRWRVRRIWRRWCRR